MKDNPDVHIHVLVPGTDAAVQQMKQELGLQFEVQAVPDLTFHQYFELVEQDQAQNIHPLRGYGIVKDGKVADYGADDQVGVHSLQIIQKAKEIARKK